MSRFIRLGALVLLLLLVLGARMLSYGSAQHDPAADATLALGFVLVVSYMAGRLVSRWGVPSITGYILVGILFGPGGLSSLAPSLAVLRPEIVDGLRLMDGAALGLIALTAGGELNLRIVRNRGRSIGYVVLAHLLVVVAGVAGLAFLLRDFVPAISDLSTPAAAAAALLLGVTAVAKSPATTIAVIQEYQARGPMTQLVLGVTVAKDVVVVTVFTAALAVSMRLVGAVEGSAAGHQGALVVAELAWEILGSLAIGLLVGWLIRVYGRRVGRELPLVVLAIAFVSGALSEDVRLSGLLVCMVAGFYVENYSEQGDALIEAVERHSLPLYIVFFTMAGAGIDLHALKQSWILALSLVVARLGFTFLATFLAARWAREPRSVALYGWSGFIGQAGVTLGFAALIAQRIPSFGNTLSSVIVAGVALNQLIGPVVFRLGLVWAGEIPSRRHGDGSSRAGGPLRRMSTRELTREDLAP
jgi:Kef-type K+ transport system membrane component KefB